MQKLQLKIKQLLTQRYERLPEKERDEKGGVSAHSPGSSSKKQFQLAALHSEGSAHGAQPFPVAVVSQRGTNPNGLC